MLDNLLVGCTGYFFAMSKPVGQGAIEALFDELRDMVENPGPNLIYEVRQTSAGITFSATCFPYDRMPGFFDSSLQQRDRIHGFMLVVEALEYLAIIKSRFEIPTDFKSEWLTRIDSGRVESAIATADAIFQKMRLRSLTTSRSGLRVKSFEGNDLANAMPMASASRSVPQRYTVRKGLDTYSATPTTGHISKRADKSGYETTIEWARLVIEALDTDATPSGSFIENFARPADLESLKRQATAIQFAIDVAEIADRLFEEKATFRLIRKVKPNAFEDLTISEAETVLAALDQEFLLSGPHSGLVVQDQQGVEIGTLRWGKARIALSSFSIRESKNIYVAPTAVVDGGGDSLTPLKVYIDREDLFIVLFDDVSFAYVNGELFQDRAMLDGGQKFLGHLIAEPCLAKATSEKGDFAVGQTQFLDRSVFRKLVDTISAGDDVLICDDLGDEWADFIGLDTTGKPPKISFYHAKHGKVSLGASPFHVSVSQAEKNLGRLDLPEPFFNDKFRTWKKMYQGEGAATSIPRMIRGGSKAQILSHARRLRASPETVKRVVIVTSSLSLKDVKKAFADIKRGAKPSAHFVQLYWLITSYFSACTEVGSIGYVVCRP